MTKIRLGSSICTKTRHQLVYGAIVLPTAQYASKIWKISVKVIEKLNKSTDEVYGGPSKT